MLQRKKPLTRKKPLRAKVPLRAQTGGRSADEEAAEEAVRKLWPLLEARSGPPFVQNERIGPYCADFACLPARMVILIANGEDTARRDWFEAQNWRVLSFAADAPPDGVLDAVADAFTIRVIRG